MWAAMRALHDGHCRSGPSTTSQPLSGISDHLARILMLQLHVTTEKLLQIAANVPSDTWSLVESALQGKSWHAGVFLNLSNSEQKYFVKWFHRKAGDEAKKRGKIGPNYHVCLDSWKHNWYVLQLGACSSTALHAPRGSVWAIEANDRVIPILTPGDPCSPQTYV